jgi:hypothetical protein
VSEKRKKKRGTRRRTGKGRREGCKEKQNRRGGRKRTYLDH